MPPVCLALLRPPLSTRLSSSRELDWLLWVVLLGQQSGGQAEALRPLDAWALEWNVISVTFQWCNQSTVPAPIQGATETCPAVWEGQHMAWQRHRMGGFVAVKQLAAALRWFSWLAHHPGDAAHHETVESISVMAAALESK